MKRIVISLFCALCVMCSFAQTQKYYCEIKGQEKDFTSGLKIVFDFGTNPVYSAFGIKDSQKLVDEKGQEIKFNSMVDAGNYLSSKGWTFLQAYTSVYGSKALVHWIFSKDSDSPEEAVKGIVTKEQFKGK